MKIIWANRGINKKENNNKDKRGINKMGYCNDCGCRTDGGVCSNCHEELAIYIQDSENDEHVDFSPEFMKKVNEQSGQIKKENKNKE